MIGYAAVQYGHWKSPNMTSSSWARSGAVDVILGREWGREFRHG